MRRPLLFKAAALALFLSTEASANILTWQDNSTIEDGYIVQMLTKGTWTEVARVGPNVTTFSDALTEGVYRVLAFLAVQGGGELVSGPSNTAAKLNAPVNATVK